MEQIEGRHPVLSALHANRPIERIFLLKDIKGEVPAKILHLAKERAIKIAYKNRNELDEISEGRLHQGVIALAEEKPLYSLEEILDVAARKEEEPFILILDGLQDPQNVGALIRTALAAGVHGMVMLLRRAAKISPCTIKAAAGAYEHMPIAIVTNISRAIERLKELGLWVAGADVDADSIYEKNLSGPLAVVIGSEDKGLSRLVREKCDYLIKLPMSESANSLNASVAGGIIMYEVMRQRLKEQTF